MTDLRTENGLGNSSDKDNVHNTKSTLFDCEIASIKSVSVCGVFPSFVYKVRAYFKNPCLQAIAKYSKGGKKRKHKLSSKMGEKYSLKRIVAKIGERRAKEHVKSLVAVILICEKSNTTVLASNDRHFIKSGSQATFINKMLYWLRLQVSL
jgi:hypothetical protein